MLSNNFNTNKKILTIGYLAPGFYKGLYVNIFAGVVEATREYNVNLLCFSGSHHGDLYVNDRQANIIFNLVNPGIVDGLVCWTSGLFINNNFIFDIEGLLKRNRDIPFVCIGKPLRDFPTLQMDNFDGIHQLVAHLVQVHGYKKIGFARGPEFHNYAVDRYQAFLDSMKKFNIPVDQRLITKPGNFDRETGEKAVNYFFKELKLKPKKDIEAIVTVSDLLAIGVIKEAQKMKINVPQDLAVVGFNNKDESIQITPQITTIDPHFVGMGKNSIKTALSSINKEEVPQAIYMPSKLIIRNSCGCKHPAFFTEKNFSIPSFNDKNENMKSFNLAISEKKENIINELNAYMLNNKDYIYNTEWTSILFESFIISLYSDDDKDKEDEFIKALTGVLEEVINNNYDIPIWQQMISKLRVLILPLIDDKEYVFKAENIFHNARVLILQMMEQSIAVSKIQLYRMDDLFPSISSAIVTTFELPALISILEKELPRLGIAAGYLSLYIDPERPFEKTQLIIAFDENGHIDLDRFNCIFLSYDLVPKGLLPEDKRFEILVQPLFFQETPLGFILFRVGPIDSNIYINLRSYISSALQGTTLVKRIGERAEELEQAYKILKENQQKLIVSEKMASLGRMTAGIAHEMNTPMAAVRASIKELGSLIDEYSKSIDNPSVLPDDHKAIVLDMTKQLNLALQSIEKSVGFIRGIKSQTFNLPTKNLQSFNASNIITDNLNLLEYIFKKSNSKLIMELDPEVNLFGEPRYLSQIVTNLVINAVDACKPNGGTVSIFLKKADEKKIQLIVKDTGVGISKENLSKIFDPFFTTKPFGEGSGLGLSIVHDMVREFNGYIEVKSIPGETTFTIVFPLKKSEENQNASN